jgi:hypothetical protein
MRKCPPHGGDVYKKFDAGGALFKDDQESYSTVEPAIDLTAPSFLMFAWRIAGTPAVLMPKESVVPAFDQKNDFQPNPLWPARRTPAKHPPRFSE